MGKRGPEVSIIGMGTRTLTEEGIKAVETALEAGITLIDTAPNYGNGKAEEVLGRIIPEYRDEIVLATKTGYKFTENGVMPDCSYETVSTLLDQSLERLNTGHVDILQVHGPDPTMSMEKVVQNLEKCVDEGKVRYIGFSNHSVPQLEKVQSDHTICIQDCLNVVYPNILSEKVPLCKKKEWGVITYMSLFLGMLAGGFDHRKITLLKDRFQLNNDVIKKLERFIKSLNELARNTGLTSSQLALGWVVSQDGVTTAIPGSQTPSHIRENVQTEPLTKKTVKTIEELQKNFEIEAFSIIDTTIVDIKEMNGVTMGLLELGIWIDVPSHTQIGEKIQIDALDGSKKEK